MKNAIYAAVIAVCIIVAVLVFVKTQRGGQGGLDTIPEDEMVWVKCRKCNQFYEMGKRAYHEAVRTKAAQSTTAMMMTPPLTCEKCGKDGIFLAEKCEKCGNVFFQNSVPADFADRCPDCKFSKTEAVRQERLEQR